MAAPPPSDCRGPAVSAPAPLSPAASSSSLLHRVLSAVTALSAAELSSLHETHRRNAAADRGLSRAFLRDLHAEIGPGLSPGQLVWGSNTAGPTNYMEHDACLDPCSLAALTKPTALSFVETCQMLGEGFVASPVTGEPYVGHVVTLLKCPPRPTLVRTPRPAATRMQPDTRSFGGGGATGGCAEDCGGSVAATATPRIRG